MAEFKSDTSSSKTPLSKIELNIYDVFYSCSLFMTLFYLYSRSLFDSLSVQVSLILCEHLSLLLFSYIYVSFASIWCLFLFFSRAILILFLLYACTDEALSLLR